MSDGRAKWPRSDEDLLVEKTEFKRSGDFFAPIRRGAEMVPTGTGRGC
jgi:hypothetical protein